MAVENNDILRVTIVGNMADGTEIANVYHFRFESLLTPADDLVVEEILDVIEGWYTLIAGELTDQLTFGEHRVYDVTQDRELGTGTFDTLAGGLSASTAMPSGTAAVLRGITTNGRRQGRKFLGPYTESYAAGNEFEAVAVANLVDFLSAYVTPALGALLNTYVPGIYNANTSPAFLAFTSGVLNNLVGYQRRRKPGVGG